MDHLEEGNKGSEAIIWNSGVGPQLVSHLHETAYWNAWKDSITSRSLPTIIAW